MAGHPFGFQFPQLLGNHFRLLSAMHMAWHRDFAFSGELLLLLLVLYFWRKLGAERICLDLRCTELRTCHKSCQLAAIFHIPPRHRHRVRLRIRSDVPAFYGTQLRGLALARNQDLPGSVKLISISACPLSKTKRIKAEVHFGFILHFAFRICERRHARIHIYLNNYSEGGSGWEGHSPVVLFMMGIQMLCQKDFTYKRASRGKSAEESHCPFCQETS